MFFYKKLVQKYNFFIKLQNENIFLFQLLKKQNILVVKH